VCRDPDDDDDSVYEIEVRDAFLEFMSKIMQDYKKFFKDVHNADGQVPERVNSRDCFNF
jgi:23S rRNA maturation mini-RNase III